MVASLMRPWVGELRLRMHVGCRIHVVVGHGAVVTTLVVNDHSHGEGIARKSITKVAGGSFLLHKC